MKIFKSIFVLYILASVFGVVGLSVLSGLGLSHFESFVIFAIWIFAVVIILSIIIKKKLEKINQLSYDCKVNEYMNAYRKLTPFGKRERAFVTLSLSTGYVYLGDMDNLKWTLDDVNIEFLKRMRKGIGSVVCYYNNYVLYYLSVGDIANAEACLERMKEAYDSPTVNHLNKATYDEAYITKRIFINMAKGDFDGAEMHFKLSLETAKQTIAKVAATYFLGEVYTHYGRLDEAREAFAYCAEHGGDTIYAKKAKEKLI